MKKIKYTISYNESESTYKVWKNLIKKTSDNEYVILAFKPVFNGNYKSCINYLKENNIDRNKFYELPN